jgi:hypothetical protein
MERSGRIDLLRTRRLEAIPLTIGDVQIWVRDQAPLHRGNTILPSGYTFEDLVEDLNRRVFFWPGTAAGPISYGIRHFKRYEHENPAILRIEFESLLLSNPDVEPRYCKYNSGSPRCSNGLKSPRGLDTFLLVDDFNHGPARVVEVTFDKEIILPTKTKISAHPKGPWEDLF